MEQEICKNCGTKLVKKATKPKAAQLRQPYYYTAYFSCPNCGRLYHDVKFKMVNNPLFVSGEIKGNVKNTNSREDEHDENRNSEGEALDIWTDGACVFNGQANARAAWSFVSGETERAGLVQGIKQTNNVAEALGIYHALLWAVSQGAKKVRIHSDSQITLHNLKKDPIAIKNNQEIFQMIADVIAANQLLVSYVKVLGHSGDINNERADKQANGLAAGERL